MLRFRAASQVHAATAFRFVPVDAIARTQQAAQSDMVARTRRSRHGDADKARAALVPLLVRLREVFLFFCRPRARPALFRARLGSRPPGPVSGPPRVSTESSPLVLPVSPPAVPARDTAWGAGASTR